MAYNYFNMGNQVMFPFKSNSPFPVDSKLVAESVTQALTLPTSSRFVGMPVFIINENKWYSFKGSIDDSSLSPIEGGASSDLSFELFSETKTYAVDDYVVHDFKLYQAIATSTGTWDSTKGNFNLVIGEDRQEETFIKIKGDFDKTVQYEVDDYVVYNQNVYKNVVPNTVGDEFNIAQWNLYIGAEEETFIKIKEVYNENNNYVIGEKVVFENNIYNCIVNTTGVFNKDNWELFVGYIPEETVVFNEWVSGTAYEVDDFVIHDCKLYKCITANSDVDFTESNWIMSIGYIDEDGVKITEWITGNEYKENDFVLQGGNLYKCIAIHTSNDFEAEAINWELVIEGFKNDGDIVITEWTVGTDYEIGDFVLLNGNLYKCITAHTSNDFDLEIANWEITIKGFEDNGDIIITEWITGEEYEINDFVLQGGNLYKCIVDHTSADFELEITNWEMVIEGFKNDGDIVITEWIAGKEYKIDDFVLQGGNLYKCTADHTSNDFETEITNWEITIKGFEDNGDIIITEWLSGETYKVDTFVLHEKCLYKCIVENSDIDFTDTNWELILDGTTCEKGIVINEWAVGIDYEVEDYVINNNCLFKCITAHTSADFETEIANWQVIIKGFEDDGDIVITEWVSANEYKIDDFVLLNGNLYKCTADNSDVDFTDTNWQLVIEGNIECDSISLREWTIGVDYEINDFVIFNKNIYKCNANHTSVDFELEIANWDLVIESNIVPETILINDWKDAVDYVEDEYVLHENCLYKCILAHTSTIFVDDIAYWELILDGTTCKGIQILEWKALNDYTIGQYVLIANSIYQAKTDHTSSLDFNTDKDTNWNRIIASGDTNVAENILYSNNKMATVDNVKSALDEIINRLNHVDLEITLSTTPSDLVNEIGSTISSVVFNWSYNKDVVLQTLTDCTLADETVRTATYTTPFDTEKTFVLDATDDEGATGSKEVKFTFLPNIYYGGAVVPSDYDDTFILGLGNKELKENAVGTYKLTTGADEYVYIAIPKIYHDEAKLIANVGGFNTELGLMATVNHTNASGYAQDYNIYRSGQKGLGKLTIVIEE